MPERTSEKSDFFEEYPPDSIEPFTHVKQDRANLPALDGPGNLGAEKDWEIPEKYAQNENVKDFRKFPINIQANLENVNRLVFAVLVIATATDKSRRDTIRETYGLEAENNGAKVFFHIGRAKQALDEIIIKSEAMGEITFYGVCKN
jgi:hypothetical protein